MITISYGFRKMILLWKNRWKVALIPTDLRPGFSYVTVSTDTLWLQMWQFRLQNRLHFVMKILHLRLNLHDMLNMIEVL